MVYAWGVQRGKRINKVSIGASWWLLVAVPPITDDYHIFHAEPEECLHATSLRRRDISAQQVEQWLDELESIGLIARFDDDQGERFGVYLDAPPKRTKNGKLAQRFPHPPPSIAVWNRELRQWKRSGASSKSSASKKSRKSTDNITEHNRTEHSSSSSSTRPVTPDDAGAREAADAAAAFAALGRIGADTSSLELPGGITADTVIRLWLTITGTPRNPIGVLVRKVTSGTQPSTQPTPAAIAKACREGVITSITLNGKTLEVSGMDALEAGTNSNGVVISNHTLPTARIGEAVFG